MLVEVMEKVCERNIPMNSVEQLYLYFFDIVSLQGSRILFPKKTYIPQRHVKDSGACL